MPHSDRLTKSLLAMIAIGIWALILRPLFMPSSVLAAPTTSREYAVVMGNDKGLNLSDGNVGLSANGLLLALKTYPKRGWHIHSVVPFITGFEATGGGGNTITSFTVILEK